VELVDVYPTLIDLCHLPAVDKLDGKSLEPLLDRPADSQQAAAFTQVLRGEIQGRSVRTARWRYTEWDQGRLGAELYDHQKDPRELFNLAGAPAWSEVQAQLKSLLQARDERRP
jgi:uncharacterized sulfatase